MEEKNDKEARSLSMHFFNELHIKQNIETPPR